MFRIKVYTWITLVVVTVTSASALASPTWNVRTWQSDEGLPDNTVMGVAQTPDGFVWVATKTGLSRFDGVQFRLFPATAAGVPIGAIEALAADRSGRLWLVKEQGVVLCIDQGRTTMVVGPRQINEGQGYLSMVVDAAGAVWITYGNDDVLRIQDGQVRFFTTADGLPENGNCHLTLDGVGRLWFSRGGWVGVFRDGRFHPLEKLAVLRIAGVRSGGIWCCSGKQFWKCTEDRPLVKFTADMTVQTVTVLYEDRAGSLWLGTRESGLFQLDGTGTVVTASLLQRTVVTVTDDREGSLWVGTRGGGLSQLKPRVVELLTTGSTTPFEPVRSIAQSTDGVLWAVLWPYGKIVRNAGQGWTHFSDNEGWSFINALCVAADPLGGVWIGTQYFGLKHWKNGTVTESLMLEDGLSGIRITALLASASGDLWIAALSLSEQQFLHCRRAGQLRTFSLPRGSGPVVALADDVAGDCWAATAKGLLLHVQADVLTNETHHTLTEPCAIRSLLVTPDNSLWIGYGGQGLGRLKDGRFTHCRMVQGLHDDYISNLLPDGRGRLWCAGNRGLFSVRIKDFEDFADNRAARVLSVVYQRKDGMPQLQASYDAWPGALRSTDGRLLFAMQSGVAFVYAEALKDDPVPPSVVIDRVLVNNKTVALYGAGEAQEDDSSLAPLELGQAGAHLRLPPGRQQVEFAFTAPGFTSPESFGFKYRLHGLDKEWVDSGTRRSVLYSQLLPGHYRFQVTACNRDGVWSKTGAELMLTVLPYFWQTAWFGALCLIGGVAGLVGTGWGIARFRTRRRLAQLKQTAALERERARIARDMHDDLGAGLTQISLVSALARAGAADAEKAWAANNKVEAIARELVRSLDEIVWAVRPQNDNLPSLVEYLGNAGRGLCEDSDVRCWFSGLPTVPALEVSASVRHNLLLAFREAVNNVLKHAGATEVRIRLRHEAGDFTVEIADNGCGFDVAKGEAKCSGVLHIRQRLAEIGGRCEFDSVIGQGTTVRLTFPLVPSLGNGQQSRG